MEHKDQIDLIEFIEAYDEQKEREAIQRRLDNVAWHEARGIPMHGAAPYREAIGGNGGPPLSDPEPVEEPTVPAAPSPPTYADLERIGQIVHGPLWEGKLAPDIAVDPRQMRRWRDGQGAPTVRAMGLARDYALRTAMRLLAAVGEDALAAEVQIVIDLKAAGAVERGREIHAAAVAKAREKAETRVVVSLTRLKPKAPRRPRAALA